MSSPTSPLDAEIANRLNDVAVPVGLLDRLHALPLASDDELDAVLADVVLPDELERRLSEVTASMSRDWPELLKQSAAAVLLFAIGLSYAFSVVVFVASRFGQPALAGEPLCSAGREYQGEPTLEQAWVSLDSTSIAPAFDAADQRASLVADASIIRQASATAELAMMDKPLALARIRESLLGASPGFSLDELNSWPTERAVVNITDGTQFDAGFWRQTGLLPWFHASDDLSLDVPLVTDDASYRLVRRVIATGRLPAAGAIRPEEFVAAIDYGLGDRQQTEPTIVLAAAPSPFGCPPGTMVSRRECRRWLVMVGVAMPDSIKDARLAIHFAPQRVKAYRVIGYGPPQSGGAASPQANRGDDVVGQATFSAGETATVLVEIELVTAEDEPHALGVVRLEWRDGEGAPQTAAETALSNDSFSDDFEAAPVAWRQAALVALAAEKLAGSPFAEEVSLADVGAFARQIEPLVSDRAGWREFIEMVFRAQSLRSSLLRAF